MGECGTKGSEWLSLTSSQCAENVACRVPKLASPQRDASQSRLCPVSDKGGPGNAARSSRQCRRRALTHPRDARASERPRSPLPDIVPISLLWPQWQKYCHVGRQLASRPHSCHEGRPHALRREVAGGGLRWRRRGVGCGEVCHLSEYQRRQGASLPEECCSRGCSNR